MVYLIFLIVSFGASIAGAICGIGGGVIIKPALDAVGVLDVATISFLSGCTVLTMSCYSVYKAKRSGESLIDMKIGTPLAIGAAVGGVVGKWMFQMVSAMFADKNMVGAVQAACLLVITLGTLIYTIYKEKIHTKHLVNFVMLQAFGVYFFVGNLICFGRIIEPNSVYILFPIVLALPKVKLPAKWISALGSVPVWTIKSGRLRIDASCG